MYIWLIHMFVMNYDNVVDICLPPTTFHKPIKGPLSQCDWRRHYQLQYHDNLWPLTSHIPPGSCTAWSTVFTQTARCQTTSQWGSLTTRSTPSSPRRPGGSTSPGPSSWTWSPPSSTRWVILHDGVRYPVDIQEPLHGIIGVINNICSFSFLN